MKTAQIYESQFKYLYMHVFAFTAIFNLVTFLVFIVYVNSSRAYLIANFFLIPIIAIVIFRYIFQNKYSMEWLPRYGLNSKMYLGVLKENVFIRLKYYLIYLFIFLVIQTTSIWMVIGSELVHDIFDIICGTLENKSKGLIFFVFSNVCLFLYGLREILVYEKPAFLQIKKDIKASQLDVKVLITLAIIICIYTGLNIRQFFLSFAQLNYHVLLLILILSIYFNIKLQYLTFEAKLFGKDLEESTYQKIVYNPIYNLMIAISFYALMFTDSFDYLKYFIDWSQSTNNQELIPPVESSIINTGSESSYTYFPSFNWDKLLNIFKNIEWPLTIILILFYMLGLDKRKKKTVSNIHFYITKGIPTSDIFFTINWKKLILIFILPFFVYLFLMEEISYTPFLPLVVFSSIIYFVEISLVLTLISKFTLQLIFFCNIFLIAALWIKYDFYVITANLSILCILVLLYGTSLLSKKQINFYVVPLILINLPMIAILMVSYHYYYFALIWIPLWYLISKRLQKEFSFNPIIR